MLVLNTWRYFVNLPGIRSGRPGVCIPAMHFQETWGAKLEEIGAGVLLTQKELMAKWAASENALVDAIRKAMMPSVVKCAGEHGEAAKKSGGVQLGADTVLSYVRDIA